MVMATQHDGKDGETWRGLRRILKVESRLANVLDARKNEK